MIKYKTISYDNRARIFWVIVGVALCSVGTYIYAVLATVHHTIAREALLGQSATLSTSVSELEFKNIALKNTVNINTALSMGFNEVKNPIFVSRTRESLSFNSVGR